MKAVRLLNRLIQSFCQLPGRARWTVGVLVMIAYSWVFYAAFVAPTGFRWRAIYGDPDYPKGYSIHGIDISHHQATSTGTDCATHWWRTIRYALSSSRPRRATAISTHGLGRISTMPRRRDSSGVRTTSGATSRRRADRRTTSRRWCGWNRETCRPCLMWRRNPQISARRSFSETSSHGFTSWRTTTR